MNFETVQLETRT